MKSPAFAATVEELEQEIAKTCCRNCIFTDPPAVDCACCEHALPRRAKKITGIQRQIIAILKETAIVLKAELAAARGSE